MAEDRQTLGDGGNEDDRGFETWTVRHSPVARENLRTTGAASYEGFPQKPGGRRWNQIGTGDFELFISYEGHKGDGSPDEKFNESLDWMGSSSEEVIESHPNLPELMDQYGGYEDGEGRVRFSRYLPSDKSRRSAAVGAVANAVGAAFGGPAAGFGLGVSVAADSGVGLQVSAATGEAVKNPLFGTETYIARRRILKHTFATRRFPKKLAELDGKIVKDVPAGTPGGKREGRDYMVFVQLLAYRGSGETGAYDCELHYIESEEGGWPPQYLVVA